MKQYATLVIEAGDVVEVRRTRAGELVVKVNEESVLYVHDEAVDELVTALQEAKKKTTAATVA